MDPMATTVNIGRTSTPKRIDTPNIRSQNQNILAAIFTEIPPKTFNLAMERQNLTSIKMAFNIRHRVTSCSWNSVHFAIDLTEESKTICGPLASTLSQAFIIAFGAGSKEIGSSSKEYSAVPCCSFFFLPTTGLFDCVC